MSGAERSASGADAGADGLRPLTEAQEGLWFAQEREPANPLFNTGQYVELTGPLDRAAFADALAQAFAEADALALAIVGTPAGPRQRVEEARRPRLAFRDVSVAADPLAEAEAAIAAEMARPTDPARDPLAAATLYRLGEARHVWHQRIHHLAVDGYGMILLTRRVASLYNAARTGEPAGAPLAPLEAAFAEDDAYRAAPRRAADAAFWQEAFADRPEAAGLSSVTAPEPSPIGKGAPAFRRAALDLPAATVAGLNALAGEAGVPWPDALTALAGAYCQRHTGTAEALVGVPHMARLGSPAARSLAMLMNVLPLRVTPDEDAPLPAFVAAVGRALVKARRHGRYRSEQLRRDLRLVGAGHRLYGPLINVLPFDETPHFGGLDARLEVLSTGPVDDITFTFRSHGTDGLRLEVDAHPRLYDDRQTEGHAGRLAAFLAAAIGASRLAEVPSVSPAEQHWLVETLNATDHAVPDTTLAALIEATMAARPDAVALTFGAASMDYRTLDLRSAALARQLAGRGIGRGDLVAIALPRSLDLLVALVAVLRAGAAYLPLDLEQPDARLARILSSAAPRLVLAQAADAARFAVAVLAPEDWEQTDRKDVDGAQAGARPVPPRPEDAAYVIYTSGSTGEPKGVVIEHRAIVNRLIWMQAHYGIGARDVILQKTPATFDVSVWEFFLPLIAGSRLVIAPPGAHRDPVALAGLIRDHGVGTLHFVPSMLAAFLSEPAVRGLALARVFCSGEELPAELRERFHRTMAGELHNLYGPTEAAVDVSFWPAGPQDRSRPVPIGHPVWNTRLYVLDGRDRVSPPGVAGQLHLGGVQLARGYLGRPDLTAERFRPDPFRPRERTYATGDLARVREDGAVVYLGRSDHQVKIRGIRIELGEIEAAIADTGLVAQAVVLARPDARGVTRLVAYAVPAADAGLAGLRPALAALLPEHMVPTAIVPLPVLPVTANGKLDRAALPEPDLATAGSSRPMTETEARIARLVAEHLKIDGPVGPDDDFFALGGDSLDAVGLLLKMRQAFGRDPGLGALFAHPGIAALARLMEAGAGITDDAGLGPVITLATESETGETAPPLFVIHPAGGISWCYGLLARSLAPRRTVHGLQAPALDPACPVAESLEALAADYARRIRAITPAGPVHLAGWSVGGILAQAVAVELAEAGVAVGAVALLDSYPCDVWRAEPDPGEDGALKALLAIAGHDPDRLPALALNRAAVIAFLRASGSALARLPDAALDGVVRVVAGNNRLVRGHHHRRYGGTLTHFRAALDHHERRLTPELWRPYAAGLIVHDITSLHAHLTGPEAVARIAPLLSAALVEAEASHRAELTA
ncbi:amino acid adenylation domain-containing protein [Ancylobacter sp. 6x-1]|uniref:Amino acid adenylation domain-containing protein n=1 Tax=Ancylobacter crimeensis TaxID=2579147 RepID=A0ABT0DB86_9HYPH|nr:amino acid adenylation domain-containing protein [Ancylobacter crimeensis]MCK0197232.1 amino acid adenylation domain-containing protein [Ancylobacter crimeensis]